MKTEALFEAIQADPDMMTILRIIRDLNLRDSWLAAGSVRNFIWNHLSGRPGFDVDTDVDVVFFDPAISYEETLRIEAGLRKAYPQYMWEVKNQVYMHLHNPATAPYQDARDAISKYPERCTAIGLRLLDQDDLDLFCPYGLEEIVSFKLQPTLHFASHPDRMMVYEERLAKKNWQEKWPQLKRAKVEEP